MPPPCCRVSAASRRFSKMPAMSSGMTPMTKQLKSVTSRLLPAPAWMRPAGRKAKSPSASKNRRRHFSTAVLPPSARSGSASAPAMRRQLSSIVASSGVPSSSFRRYFMSQICWARGESSGMPRSKVSGLQTRHYNILAETWGRVASLRIGRHGLRHKKCSAYVPLSRVA